MIFFLYKLDLMCKILFSHLVIKTYFPFHVYLYVAHD